MPLILALTKDPQGRPTFAFTGIRATLGNPLLRHGLQHLADRRARQRRTNLKRVKASLFRKKAFTIRLAGSTAEGGIAYRLLDGPEVQARPAVTRMGRAPAPWRSGYAAACKAVYTGSIPVGAFWGPRLA